MAKMRISEMNGSFVFLILLGVLSLGKGEVYIVTLEGEPVISYKGGVSGFEATAVEFDSDEKLDVTRCSCIPFTSLIQIFAYLIAVRKT